MSSPPPLARQGHPAPLKVLCYPAATNPYQRLLGAALRRSSGSELRIRAVKYHRYFGAIPLCIALPYLRVRGFSIVHIHWPEFRISRYLPLSRQVSTGLSHVVSALMRVCRFRVVWTVHNITPHESHTIDDLATARRLAKDAAVKFVHSETVLDEMRAAGFETSNTRVIPHGNYIGVYQPSEVRAVTRRDLGVTDTNVLVAFVGIVRAYKGVEDLLEAYRKLPATLNARLLVAGSCTDARLRARIATAARDGVVVRDGHIPDRLLGSYLDAADVVCLPFRKVTTSGSALLAMSLGLPIVAPRLGALNDIPDAAGYFYDAANPTGLMDALAQAVEADDRSDRGAAALRFAASQTWEDAARATLDAYRQIAP